MPREYPWEAAAAMEAITYFARAMGAARSGRFEQARADLETLAELQERVAAKSPYWGTQVEVQRLSALAWLQFEEGSRDAGLATMRQAAELEASTEKHPITPGEVLPARELLADMLLDLGQPGEALTEYQAAAEVARGYYDALVEVTANADTDRERLQHARGYLAEG
jgi:tetratricopeptide (TPR) repeat protein